MKFSRYQFLSGLLPPPELISVLVATDPPLVTGGSVISAGGQNGIFPPKVSVCGNSSCRFRDLIDHLLRPTRPAQHNRLCSRLALGGPDPQKDTVAISVALPAQT